MADIGRETLFLDRSQRHLLINFGTFILWDSHLPCMVGKLPYNFMTPLLKYWFCTVVDMLQNMPACCCMQFDGSDEGNIVTASGLSHDSRERGDPQWHLEGTLSDTSRARGDPRWHISKRGSSVTHLEGTLGDISIGDISRAKWNGPTPCPFCLPHAALFPLCHSPCSSTLSPILPFSPTCPKSHLWRAEHREWPDYDYSNNSSLKHKGTIQKCQCEPNPKGIWFTYFNLSSSITTCRGLLFFPSVGMGDVRHMSMGHVLLILPDYSTWAMGLVGFL
jgi:hypothetical protein